MIFLERIKRIEPLWGHWTIGRPIGDGSFGSVYEAIDQKRIEPNAALKIMTVEFKQDKRWQTAEDMLTALQNCAKKPEQSQKTVFKETIADSRSKPSSAKKTVTPQKSPVSI